MAGPERSRPQPRTWPRTLGAAGAAPARPHHRGTSLGTAPQPRAPRQSCGCAWALSPSGLQGTPPSSPARWPPRCCRHRRTPPRPAGTPAPSLSQPLQEPGVPISAPHPVPKGVPGCGFVPCTTRGELAGRCWAGSGSPHFLALVGRGGGRDTALQLGKECEQPRQILARRPCYIRGFSRVTSAPPLASDLVSVAELSGPEVPPQEHRGAVPEVTPCTTPWVLLPEGRKRQRAG